VLGEAVARASAYDARLRCPRDDLLSTGGQLDCAKLPPGGDRVLRNLKLKLTKRGRKPVLVNARGVKAVLVYGSAAKLELTGLPRGTTHVQVTLKGAKLAFAPAAPCEPTSWAAKLTDAGGRNATARAQLRCAS